MAGEFQAPHFTQDSSPFAAASKAISERGSPSDDITKAFQTGMGLMQQGQKIADTEQQHQLNEALNPIKIDEARQTLRKQTIGNDFDEDTYDARAAKITLDNAKTQAQTAGLEIAANTGAYNLKKSQDDAADGLVISKLLNHSAGLDPIDDAQKLLAMHDEAAKAAKTKSGMDAIDAWWDKTTGIAQAKSSALVRSSMAQDVYLGGFTPDEREKYFDLVHNKEYDSKTAYGIIKSQSVQVQKQHDEDFRREGWDARNAKQMRDVVPPSQIHPDDVAIVPKDFPKLMQADDNSARHLNGLLAAAQTPEGANDPKIQKDIAIAVGQINERRRQIQGITSGIPTLKGDYGRAALPEDPAKLIDAYRRAHADPDEARKQNSSGGGGNGTYKGGMIKTKASQFGDATDANGVVTEDNTDVGQLPASQARTMADGTPFEQANKKAVVALPESEMKRLGLKLGDKIIGKLGDGPEVPLTLGEVGPGKARVAKGFGADLTQAAIVKLGGKGHEKGGFNGDFSYRPMGPGDGDIAGAKGGGAKGPTLSLSKDSEGQKLKERVNTVKPGDKWEDPQTGKRYTIVS